MASHSRQRTTSQSPAVFDPETQQSVDLTMEDSELERHPTPEPTPVPEQATTFLRHTKLRIPRSKIFTTTKTAYLTILTRQIHACSRFDTPLNATELSLRGVRDKLSTINSQLDLMNLHTRDGRTALKHAQTLLQKEWERSVEMAKVLRKAEERAEFEERFVDVKAGKSIDCDEDVQFCEGLMRDLQEVREARTARLRERNAGLRA